MIFNQNFRFKKIENFINVTGEIFLFSKETFPWLFKKWINPNHIFKQMYLTGVTSLPVVLITGSFTGMVLAVQTYYQLRTFTLETGIATIIGLSMSRELGPVLTGLMLAGRVGAAYAAELGTMRVTEQIDALESLATNPIRYLVVPRFLSCLFLTPLLTAFSVFIGICGGYFVGVKLLGVPHVFFIDNLKNYVEPHDILSGLIKSVFFGMAIAIVGCYKGFNTQGGAEGVGQATTTAVVLSCMIILISDFFLSVILF